MYEFSLVVSTQGQLCATESVTVLVGCAIRRHGHNKKLKSTEIVFSCGPGSREVVADLIYACRPAVFRGSSIASKISKMWEQGLYNGQRSSD